MREENEDRNKRMQNWKNITGRLVAAEKELPAVWPAELPPEDTKDFWFTACRYEMMMRKEISRRMRLMFRGEEMGDVLPLDAWLFRRRMEWAGQMALTAMQKNVPPAETAETTLEQLLVESWETSGCISMWKHAEREGRPHPENPDGLTPLGPR